MSFENKVAVITGGGSGIGLAIARQLHEQGAKVVIFGRNPTTLTQAAQTIGPNTLTVAGDVRQLADLNTLFETTKSTYGPIDVLVANAGIGNMGRLDQMTEEAFDLVADINFKGTYFTVQQGAPFLADGAAVILVTSIINERGFPGLSVYAATKAAIRSLARTFAAELLPRGIRVNALSPGPVETPFLANTGLPPHVVEMIEKGSAEGTPMKRAATADEIANAALFLASDAASYVVGTEFVIDGGASRLPAAR